MGVLTIDGRLVDSSGKYVGPDLSDYNGSIKISNRLGSVYFDEINCAGDVIIGYDSHVETLFHMKVGGDLHSNSTIRVGSSLITQGAVRLHSGINVGWCIRAAGELESGGRIEAGDYIEANNILSYGGAIIAGGSIESRGSIKSIEHIMSGLCITAGGAIEAEWGIQAQSYITCKGTLSAGCNIFAGLCAYKPSTRNDTEITCAKLIKGKIAYGRLVETGIEKPEKLLDGKIALIDGKEYVLSLKEEKVE